MQEESAMKMNSTQIEQTLFQLDAEAIPADHPVIPQLEGLFGDHTYFLDKSGLNIVEPLEPADEPDGQMGVVVNLASWTDAGSPSLAPHQPESTDLVVTLGGNRTN
jgi:hypothetical protein